MKKEELSPEEIELLEKQRKRSEDLKSCCKEIEEVLLKYNMNLKVHTNPVINIEPRT